MAVRCVLIGAGYKHAREPPERRIMRLLAQRDLARIERFAIPRDERAHDRMLGLMGLQIAMAAASLAASAAYDLMQQLKRPFGRARIAIGEAEIAIYDANQVKLGEVMPLGDELRADDDVEAA